MRHRACKPGTCTIGSFTHETQIDMSGSSDIRRQGTQEYEIRMHLRHASDQHAPLLRRFQLLSDLLVLFICNGLDTRSICTQCLGHPSELLQHGGRLAENAFTQLIVEIIAQRVDSHHHAALQHGFAQPVIQHGLFLAQP